MPSSGVQRLLRAIARSSFLSGLALPVARELLRQDRAERLDRRVRLARQLVPDLVVRHGPFAGMRYAEAQAHGSVLVPKLLGCYERELHASIENLIKAKPTTIVDVGCAEGYYAVGLARRLPDSTVRAFDIDPQAREACRAMAIANAVGQRVHLGEHCSAADLVDLAASGNTGVIADCEGAERWLFNEATVPALTACHLLIEVHDFIHEGTGDLLIERLRSTHDVKRIAALSDQERAEATELQELEGLPDSSRSVAVREGRPPGMYWLVATPHAAASNA